VVETISGTGELMKEIDRRLRVTDTIIRHLTVRIDEDLKVAEPPAQRAQGDPGPPPHGARPAARAAGVRAARRPGQRRSGRWRDGP
jgi:small subunit ribosomal protein S6